MDRVQRAAGHAAQSGRARHATEAVVGVGRSGRMVAGILCRWCVGSEARAAPGDGGGTACHRSTGGASEGIQGAIEAAAGGRAKRLVA